MSLISDIQKAELDLLKCCRDVCERHKIDYYLAFGTLIGAARHKGFIPWDDDIDIMIPAEQTEAFKRFFVAEAPKEYFVADICSERYSLYAWMKVRNSDTASMPVKYKNIPVNWGICIDIFPIYNVCEKDFKRALFLFNAANKLLSAPMLACEDKPSAFNRVLAHIPVCVRRYIAQKATDKLKSFENGGFRFDGWELIANDVFGDTGTYLEFEGEKFRVPLKWHELLTEIYGDYMTPPPESERGGHDLEIGKIIWDTKESYKKYK